MMERRDFLRAGAVATCGSVLPGLFGCSTGASINSTPVTFDSAETWAMVPEILAKIVPPTFPNRDFSILDYGASHGRGSNAQPGIAAAIQACSAAGGGRVVIPAGSYTCNGPIHLLSNVNLYLAKGALVRFSDNPDDYLPVVEVRYIGIRCMNYSPFIYANNQENIAITGSGTFDGQSSSAWATWVSRQDAAYTKLAQDGASGVPVSNRVYGTGYYLRPTMLEPYSCKNILIEGVTFRGSAFWTLHPTFCTNVTIQNVKVQPGIANDDGCDPDSCTNVLVQHCTFQTNDDNISVKAGSGKDTHGLPSCSDIVFQNCATTGTNFGSFSIGTNVSGGVNNVFVEGFSAGACQNAYLIKGNRNLGGQVSDIHIRNSSASECHHLLSLLPGYFTSTAFSSDVPQVGPVSMQNMSCTNASVSIFEFSGYSYEPIFGVYISIRLPS